MERDVYHKPEEKILLRTADVYQTEAPDDVASYSDRLLAIVADFKNSGAPEGYNAQSMVGKSKRGEVACRLFARIDSETGIIEAAGFKTRGCLAMTGCASAACQLIEGKGIEEALELTLEDIRAFVDGVPAGKVNALHFAECAVRALVGDFLLRDGTTLAELDEAVPCDELSVSCIMAEHCSLRQSRLECRMEEEEARKGLIANNACAEAIALIRSRTAAGKLTMPGDWMHLAPDHMTPGEFDEMVLAQLDEDSDGASTDDLTADAVRANAAPPAPERKPSPFANRGVGVPRIFGSAEADAEADAAAAVACAAVPAERTAYEYGETAPAGEDDDFELVPPEGFELVQVDGRWGLVETDAPRTAEPQQQAIDAAGIKVMRDAQGAPYLYDGGRMKPAYARWAFLGTQDDPLTTFAYLVREESRTYPRPMAESDFANDPINMGEREVRAAWERAQQMPELADIRRTQASNGDVYYFSADHLDEQHAASLAEWQSVGRFFNV